VSLQLVAAPPLADEGEALVTLRDASVSFGRVEALRNVSLTLRRGERLVLVGENGAGKTTLLRLLQGLVASPGRTEHVPNGRPLKTAMLFQRPFLLRLSVRRNLLLALWLGGVPAAERPARAARALARVGLGALADRPARTLSGGQQQRLALARAWMLEPDVLLLDEPTASLDPTAKREVESLIESLARDGITLVMSTHNLGQAKRLATRVAYLEGGRLLACLPTAAFFDPRRPPTAAAAFLKGELPWT
jgi:tungstate transport system ATP-binding protein